LEASVREHVKVVGILQVVLGAMSILGGLIALLIMGGVAGIVGVAAHGEEGARIAIPVLGAVGLFVCVLCLILSLPNLIAGYGLLKRRPWGRIVAIVVSALCLLSFPFGTAVGIYSLWVLLQPETQALLAGSRARATW
jgi:hypothetical protein